MNIKEYIASGVLEQYLLGELSALERKEVEKVMAQYPEVRQEYFLLTDTLEKLAQHISVIPPNGLRDQIMESITGEATKSNDTPEPKKKTKPNNYLLLIILALASLSGFIIAGIVYYRSALSTRLLEQQISNLSSQTEGLKGENSSKNEQIDQLREVLEIIGSPDFNLVPLKGLPIAPQAYAQVFWNQQTSAVLLRADHLPQPASGKQYQLWAFVNNVPSSIGVFDFPTGTSLLKMSDTINATAFAITLEPVGGADVPTSDAMYVFGKVITN